MLESDSAKLSSYSGSQFRYERAQRGRYRHFWQVGAEALGAEDPALDAELIILASDGYAGLGLTGVRLLITGCFASRLARWTPTAAAMASFAN